MKKIYSFFEIEYNEKFFDNIFRTLKKIIDFEYGSIVYYNEKPKYVFGKKPCKMCITDDLKIKNTKFGEIMISSNKFFKKDIELFKSCVVIISNVIKDYELSKIMKMQVKELEDGYLKVKQAEEIKTKFISHMSHELRTPLNSILGYSELLGNDFAGKLNDKQKEYLNDIKISGLNLLEMINEILDMSKIEAGVLKLNKSEFNIEQLVYEVENIIKPLLLKKNIKLISKVDNYSIFADYQKLQQILLNILSNAIKFTKNEIIISTEKRDNLYIISIKDNGIGIREENIDKIFDKFEQLNMHVENSTGLGLSITKELVKLHNGEIYVKSKFGEYTEFIIKIPNMDKN